MSDQSKIGIGIVFLILSLSLAYAISTNPSSISLNSTYSQQLIEFIGLNSTISLTLSSSISNYAQLNFDNVDPINKYIIISLKNNVPSGSYIGSINFDSGSVAVGITIPQTPPNNTSPSQIIVFPTSKVISVQQGSEKTQNILISVPSTYPRVLTINAVNFNPGT